MLSWPAVVFAVQQETKISIEAKVENLLKKMTLEEKIGQLLQYPELCLREGENFSPKKARNLIHKHKIGSLLKNVAGSSPEEWAKIANEIQKIASQSRLGIPIIIGDDIIHGYAMLKGGTVFPQVIGLASTWDTELVQSIASVAAKEARRTGTHWAFSPTLSVVRDPRWGRVEETFGEDTYLVSQMGVAVVKGYQGDDLRSPDNILAGPKHFAGDGQPRAGLNSNPTDVSQRTLRSVILPPFEAVVKAGAENIMAAHNPLNGVPCHANQMLLTKILRQEWGFDGFVVSDWSGVENLCSVMHVADRMAEAAKKAVEAGTDMEMVGGCENPAFGEPLLQLVKQGKVSEKTIDQAVSRILRAKFRLGLFENPYVDPNEAAKIVNCKKHKKLALRAAHESIVLLKNQGNLLPLNKSIGSIAIIGPNADNIAHQLGDWTKKQPRENIVTVLDGIKNKVSPNTKVQYAQGCNVTDTSKTGFEEAIRIAKESDVVILVVGGASERYASPETRTCGECFDRADLDLPGVQEDLVKAIAETKTPVVVVLVNGRPLTVNWIAEHIPAILEAWYPGQEGGSAVADILFGDYNPAGRLPITFPQSVGQIPLYYNLDGGPRFRDYVAMNAKPLFPFGYGLSYTKFEYKNLQITPKQIALPKVPPDGKVKISVEVQNVGDHKGDEVVQLYVRDVVGSVITPAKELKGFKRITLNPGQKQTVSFTLHSEQLSLYNLSMERVVEPGSFKVWVGPNSTEGLEGNFEVVPAQHQKRLSFALLVLHRNLLKKVAIRSLCR